MKWIFLLHQPEFPQRNKKYGITNKLRKYLHIDIDFEITDISVSQYDIKEKYTRNIGPGVPFTKTEQT